MGLLNGNQIALLLMSLCMTSENFSGTPARFFRPVQNWRQRMTSKVYGNIFSVSQACKRSWKRTMLPTIGLAASYWYYRGHAQADFQKTIIAANTNFESNTIEIVIDPSSHAWRFDKDKVAEAIVLAKTDPARLLQLIQSNLQKFYESQPDMEKLVQKESMEQIEERFMRIVSDPLSLLRECSECGLARTYNALPRARFGQEVGAALIQRAKYTQGKVSYVDIGSGGLFQLAMSVAHALHSPAIKELAIHIIDPHVYGEFIGNLKDTQGQFPFSASFLLQKYSLSIEPIHDRIDSFKVLPESDDELCHSIWKHNRAFYMEKKDALINTKMELAFQYSMLQQLAAWCRAHAPQVDLRIFVHGTCDDYTANVRKGSISPADIISFADPDPNYPYHIGQQCCALMYESAQRLPLSPVGIGLCAEHYSSNGKKEDSIADTVERAVVARLWKGKESKPTVPLTSCAEKWKKWIKEPYFPIYYMYQFSKGWYPAKIHGRRYVLEKGVSGYTLTTEALSLAPRPNHIVNA